MEVYRQSRKLTARNYCYNADEKFQSCRVKAGNANSEEDESNEDSNSSDLQYEQPKRKRKKRLKPLPSEFVNVLNGKQDKYGIAAAYTAKNTRKTPAHKNVRSLQERLQNKYPDRSPDPPPAPRFTLKPKRNQQVYTANIRKLPPVSENERPPKKLKTKRESRAKSTSKVASMNTNQISNSRKSFNDNIDNNSMYSMRSQRSGDKIDEEYPYPSPTRSQKKLKSMNTVSFRIQNQRSNYGMNSSKESLAKKSDSLQPMESDLEDNPQPKSRTSLSQIVLSKIGSNSSVRKIKSKLSSITSLISARKSTSNASQLQKRSRSASPVPQQNEEENISRASRSPSPPPATSPSLQHIPTRVGSTSSITKRKSLKKKSKPRQILLSMFRQPDKNTEKTPPEKSNLKTKKEPTPEVNGKEAKVNIKENEALGMGKQEPASTSEKKPVLKTESQRTLKSSSSTRVKENPSGNELKSSSSTRVKGSPSRNELKSSSSIRVKESPSGNKTVRYNPEMKTLFKKDFPKLNSAHGFMKDFFKKLVPHKNSTKSKENMASTTTNQIRAHAYRKTFLNIVARMSEKEKSVHQKMKSIAPPPYPRVHGFTQPVLARFKCGRLQEKEDEIQKIKRKIIKKEKSKTELESSQSKVISVKSEETVNTSKHTMKTTESTVVTKSKTVEKKKGKDDNDSDDDDVEKKITEIITTTTVTEKTQPNPNCPYVLTTSDKKDGKRCCCQFIKSLPPTPRENFRKNPGNPHFYPAPGYRHAWGYDLKVRRLERLEEERQRLCAEQRGIPYTGPPRQYQDFFEDTPVEDRCCCDDHVKRKRKGPDPNGFECNNGDPHLHPTLAGFKHYFANKESIKEAERELEELRKQCEETFPEIKPLINKKKDKSCDCRGAIVSGEKAKEERIKEIVEKMAAICTCLDDCDCKAALQAKEPYINVDDEMEVCCCSRKPPQTDETFDCNAGDPHLQPTVAAFLHAYEFGRRKKDRIAKRKSIYDEIVQHGTEEEIKEARVSLLKQIAEDGTKEEQQEARASLELEETQVIVETEITRLKQMCSCPEIQEIVVMIEDSDCEEPVYAPCATEYEICEYDPEEEYMLPEYNMPEYQDEMQGWEDEPFIEMPQDVQENEAEPIKLLGVSTLQTQTPSGEHLLTLDPKQTTETQTPRTLHTQTENTLQTQTPPTKKASESEINRISNKDTTKSEASLRSTNLETKKSVTNVKSTEDTKIKEDVAVKSEDAASKTSKLALKDNIFKGLKDIKLVKAKDAQSGHSIETSIKTATDHDSDVEKSSEKQELAAKTDAKKRKHKSTPKCTAKATKLTKAEQCMYKSLQPPKCVIKPRCVCVGEKKTKIPKEKDSAKQAPKREKSTQGKCVCCCNCEETGKPMRSKKPQKEDKRESNTISEGVQTEKDTETAEEPRKCTCVCDCKELRKFAREKTRRQSKCKENLTNTICESVIKSLRPPRSYSLPEAKKRKRNSARSSVKNDEEASVANTNPEPWAYENDIYYPPPEPLVCQPGTCAYYNTADGLPDKEIFNFPPPKFSSIYQEYPQNGVNPENDMVFSVQIEQDRSSTDYVPIQMQNVRFPQVESETSFRVIFTDEPCGSESSGSLSKENKKQTRKQEMKNKMNSCRCKKPAELNSCRCKKPTDMVPCMCNNQTEKIPCRC